jgi:hypothetical protein
MDGATYAGQLLLRLGVCLAALALVFALYWRCCRVDIGWHAVRNRPVRRTSTRRAAHRETALVEDATPPHFDLQDVVVIPRTPHEQRDTGLALEAGGEPEAEFCEQRR